VNQAPTSDSFQPHFMPGEHEPMQGPALAGPVNFDLRYVVSAVRANLWLILAIIGAVLALALAYTLLQTPRYTASASLQINDSSGRILGDEADPGEEQVTGWYDTERFLKTQTDIIKSRGLAQRVAQRLKLVGNDRFYATHEVAPPPADAKAEARRDQVIALLRDNLTVDLPRDSRIVAIRYESTDAGYSAEIANAYAAEYIQSNLQRRFDSSSYARTFLSEQLETARRKLEESERALNAYARDNALIRTGSVAGTDKRSDDDASGSVTTSSLLQINAAANEATARRIEAEGRWQAISGVPLLSAPQVVSNQTVSALLAEQARARAALAEEQSRHLEEHPAVKAKREELESITGQLQQAAANARQAVRAEYQSAVAVERQLAAEVNQLKGATLAEQDRTVQYGLLARDVDTNRQVYDGLLERFKTLNAIAGVSLSNINVIDLATVPNGPSSPNLFKNLALGLILGLGLAALTVFLRDQFDDSIRVPEDVEPKLALPLLGVVPRSQQGEPEAELGDPKSPISEAYNSLRGSLLYSTPTGLPRILLVTSAQPGEGKSTTSSAIAAGLARMGRRTLLIDADLRRPSLHRQFARPNEEGLSTLLTSARPLAELAVPSGLDNLALVLAGPIPPSPTELLSTNRIDEVLREAAKAFDVVVIDSPPVLGLADSPLMAALADGVVFVVEADRSRRGALKASLRRLRAMRPMILGAVLTKFDPLKTGNRYSEYYGYDYYQYDSARA
jgi:capsular exopolysaccharide synthesis family protein